MRTQRTTPTTICALSCVLVLFGSVASSGATAAGARSAPPTPPISMPTPPAPPPTVVPPAPVGEPALPAQDEPGGTAPRGRPSVPDLTPSLQDGGGALASSTPEDGPLPELTFTSEAFQSDLFTGAATATIPILVPRGAAGVAPPIVLQYSSSAVDDLDPAKPAHNVGLGWTLDVGGFIARDTKWTATESDDQFRLVWGGARHDLVLVDAGQNIYHTKDDLFLRIQRFPSTNSWVLTTKDGVQYRYGANDASRAYSWDAFRTVRVAYRYYLDQIQTASGVQIRYTYAKHVASLTSGVQYDQAAYPDTITYAFHNGSPVPLGLLREVKVLRALRADRPADGPTDLQTFHEREAITAIEVRVGGVKVRRYEFGQDYSIDRDPGASWPGGAAGDLTLTSVTLRGSINGMDWGPPLPAATTFTYWGPSSVAHGRLKTASNGYGATVSYSYDRLDTPAIWLGCKIMLTSCLDLGGGSPTAPTLNVVRTLGAMPPETTEETVPLYSVALAWCGNPAYPCQWRVATSTQGAVQWAPLGHAFAPSVTLDGTVKLCSVTNGGDTFPDAREDCGTFPHLGNIYRGPIDRTRVTRREVSDVVIWSPTVTTVFDYGIPTVSSDGSEFRGHDVVRSTDAYGHYLDTYFHQSDALKGRVREIQQYSAGSLLFTKTRNTWEAVQPYAGVTFARLNQTDVETYDGGATPQITTTRFAYDAYGNRTRTEADGDTSAAGDERDEEVDWAINTNQWIHRPSRIAVKERTGAVARERWLSYDNLPWGQVGTRGVLTREEFRVTATGGRDAQGNPVVQYGYDAYGNQSSRTGPPTTASLSGCTTTTDFDDDRAYPRVVRTCLQHETTYVTDQRWGRPTSVQDSNGKTTSYLYDEFGRLARVTRPMDAGQPPSSFGTVTYWYVDVGVAGLQRVLAARTEEHGTANHLWTEEFFDGQGQVYFRRAEGPAQGTVIQQETARDARGQVWAQSVPHAGTETAQWTTYLYDPIGRQVAVTRPDGKTSWTAYAPGIVTLTNERGKVRHHFPDGLGRLAAVQEVNDTGTPAPVYTTWYEYTAAGDLREITNHAGSVTTITYDVLGRRRQIQDPNMGTWDYTYDAAGNLIEQQDAQQPRQVTRFEYDAQDRLRFKRFVGTSSAIEWRYDEPAGQHGIGRLTKIVDLATITDLQYDTNGRVTQVTRLLDGTSYVLTRTYDALDRVRTEGFSPGGAVMSYTYDLAGRVQKIAEGPTEIIKNVTYNARGQRETQEYGNLLWSRWTYHPTTFRVQTRKTGTQGTPATMQDFAYTYDDTGNVKTITDGFFTGARTFEYDAVNRLTRGQGPFGPGQATLDERYTYNGIGNLTEKRLGETSIVDYVYGDPLHASAVTATPQEGRAYTYDLNGSMTTHRTGSRPLTWTRDYRLATLEVPGGSTASFAYDADGLRVRKTWVTGTATVTRYPFPGYEVASDGTVTQFLRVNGELVAARRSTGQTYYYHTDHLGSVHVITNSAGQRVQLVEYDPWGRVSRLEGTIDPTTRFTGQRLDPETGLMDYGARYYDPELRRFISADPLLPGPGDQQGLNRYSYVLNNPVAYIDPNGREPITAATLGTLAAVGFAFGATSGALAAIQRPGATGWDVAAAAGVGGLVGAATAPLRYGQVIAAVVGFASYSTIHFAAGGSASDFSFRAGASSALAATAGNRFVGFLGGAEVPRSLAQVVGGEVMLGVDLLAGVVASQVPSTLPGVLPPMDPSWLPFSPIGLDPLRGQPIPGSDGAAERWRLPMLDSSPAQLLDPLSRRVSFAVPGHEGAPGLSVPDVALGPPTWWPLPSNYVEWR